MNEPKEKSEVKKAMEEFSAAADKLAEAMTKGLKEQISSALKAAKKGITEIEEAIEKDKEKK